MKQEERDEKAWELFSKSIAVKPDGEGTTKKTTKESLEVIASIAVNCYLVVDEFLKEKEKQYETAKENK